MFGISVSRRARRNFGRGAAAVEFALVLPLFCAVVFGIIDYGWYFYQRMSIAAAIRDGLRTGVTVSQTATSPNDYVTVATTRAKADLVGSAIDPSAVTWTTATSSSYPTASLTLSATYTPKALINFVPFPSAPATFSMTMMFELQIAP